MSFQKLVGILKAEAALTKSHPLSKQSLDTALKSCGDLGYGADVQGKLKELHAAGIAANVPDQELEGHISGTMRHLATKKPMTKSQAAGEALQGQLEGSQPAQAVTNNMTMGQPVINADVVACHLAVQNRTADAAFVRELSDLGVSTSDMVQVQQILSAQPSSPEHRNAFYQAVRNQVTAANAPETLSPAARGIDWGK